MLCLGVSNGRLQNKSKPIGQNGEWDTLRSKTTNRNRKKSRSKERERKRGVRMGREEREITRGRGRGTRDGDDDVLRYVCIPPVTYNTSP